MRRQMKTLVLLLGALVFCADLVFLINSLKLSYTDILSMGIYSAFRP